MSRLPLIAIPVLLGAGALLFRLVGDDAPPLRTERGTASSPDPAPASGAELAALRQQVARLEQQVRAAHAGPPPSTTAPDDDRAPAGAPASPAEEARARRDFLDGVDAAFRAELGDPTWAATASSTVQAALAADADLRALARDIECRSRTCRIELTDDGSLRLGKLLPIFVHRLAGALPDAAARRLEGADGTATMVLYLSRPPADLAPGS